MFGQYLFPSNLWPASLVFVFLIGLSCYGWYHRNVPGALMFAISAFFSALWAGGAILEMSALEPPTKIFWLKFQALWQLPAATMTTCFVLTYVRPGRWLNRRLLILLSVPCVLAFLLILSNDLHHLCWSGFLVTADGISPQIGPAISGFVIYGGLIGGINLVAFTWLFVYSPPARWLVVLILLGQLGARTVYFFDRFLKASRFEPFDILLLGYLFLMYAIALFAFQLFNPLRQARQRVLSQIRDGVLVIDLQSRVMGLNPAGEAMLRLPEKRALGRFLSELLPGVVLPEDQTVPGAGQMEIHLKDGPEPRDYILAYSSLKDLRGLVVGRLLILNDVTEQKRTQAQIIEQQRALATLTERERMARELHDSLGQVLGYAGFQIEAANQLLHAGNSQKTAELLERLGPVIREAHADLRENILNLRSSPSLQQPFFKVVEQYLEGVSCNHGIQTRLEVDDGMRDDLFSPVEQLHLFRILQEALSNARKHGHAHTVRVRFEDVNEQVQMSIIDDGQGFTPLASQPEGEAHFGLAIMHERAELVGGRLNVQSAPGAGTQVVLTIPKKEERVARTSG